MLNHRTEIGPKGSAFRCNPRLGENTRSKCACPPRERGQPMLLSMDLVFLMDPPGPSWDLPGRGNAPTPTSLQVDWTDP